MQGQKETSGLSHLFKRGKHRSFPKSHVLYMADENMFFSRIDAGFIKRYSLTNDGSQSIQVIYGPGDSFPLTPVFNEVFHKEIYKGREIFYYETITPVSLHSVDRETFRRELDKDLGLYRHLLEVAGERLGSNIQKLENISLRVSNRRVVHQLLYYADVFGKETAQGVVITLPLTHQTLAAVLDLARETVSHCLSRLNEQGLIVAGKNITVPDIDKLRSTVR